MNVLHYMRIIARALDYAKDPDPKHWKTINGSHVHLDKNGNYDGGAGSKFNGRHHYGPDWRQKSALMNRLAAALHGGVAKGQAQGNAQVSAKGTGQGKNVASQVTNGTARNGTIKAEEEKKIIENIRNLHDATKQAYDEYKAIERRLYGSSSIDPDLNQKFTKARLKLQRARDAENKARDDATAKDIPFVSAAWNEIEEKIIKYNPNRVPAAHHTNQPSESEIISRISGGDLTGGSCSSVAFTYIANKCGLDVLDFRGGASCELFRDTRFLDSLRNLPGLKITETRLKKEAIGTADCLLNLEKEKEYYCWTGGHAAIVKNTDKGVKYLELQSAVQNGWKFLGANRWGIAERLHSRFGARKTVRGHVYLAEVESFKGSREFERLSEYFNTKMSDQKKGARGHAK